MAQSGPEFLACTDTVPGLCVQDDGVRLPASNQVFLGAGHPDATRGSVHVSRSKAISGGCGNEINYKVELLAEDSITIIPLKPWTEVSLDTTGVATLLFDTELSPDSVIRHAGMAYNADCTSNYTIIWTAMDSCGMEVSCAEELHLYDCSPPVPGASAGTYTKSLPLGCFLTLFAKDFDTGSVDDRNSFQQMLFSFDQNSYTSNLTVICQYDFYVELTWSIWIADQGEDYNCNGHISWNERNKVEQTFNIVFTNSSGVCCEPDLDSTLTGRITTIPNNTGINMVSVSLHRPGSIFPTSVTGPDGHYIFNVMLTDDEATIIPEKDIGHKNGVTTLDLVRIQKHLLGRELFTSPDQYISADVNHSQSVSAIDLIELRKLILGVYSEFPSNTSWKFAAKDPGFVDSLGGVYYEPTISFTNQLPFQPDFYGIKIGDVNYTANPLAATSVLPRSAPTLTLVTQTQSARKGETLKVPFSLSRAASVLGFQFTLDFPGFEFAGIQPGRIDLSDENYVVFDDQLTMSWFDENYLDLSPGDVIFTLVLQAVSDVDISQSLSINSDITEAELYLANEEIYQPVLTFQNQNIEDRLEIISFSPNPWKEETSISFYLPESDEVTFSLFEVAGRKVYSETQFLKKGFHEHQLKSNDFSDRGVMFFEISTSNDNVVKKMIVLD